MAPTVRPATVADAADVASLTTQLGYDVDTPAAKTRLAHILGRPDHRFLLATVDGRAVAWVHVAVAEFVETGRIAIVCGLVVDRDCRKRGVGRTLMEHAERWAREQDCASIHLWSSERRTDAHAFYGRVGYARVKTQYAFAKSLDV